MASRNVVSSRRESRRQFRIGPKARDPPSDQSAAHVSPWSPGMHRIDFRRAAARHDIFPLEALIDDKQVQSSTAMNRALTLSIIWELVERSLVIGTQAAGSLICIRVRSVRLLTDTGYFFCSKPAFDAASEVACSALIFVDLEEIASVGKTSGRISDLFARISLRLLSFSKTDVLAPRSSCATHQRI
jgi:hypothetical protein